MKLRVTIFLLSGITMMACRSTPSTVSGSGEVIARPDDAGDPFILVEAHVEGDSLIATLRYGGGFRTHDFLIESTGPATKSLPRQQPLRILHNGNGDMGRALIEERRSFDLSPFRDPTQPRIMLRLDSWEDLLEYPYTD